MRSKSYKHNESHVRTNVLYVISRNVLASNENVYDSFRSEGVRMCDLKRSIGRGTADSSRQGKKK